MDDERAAALVASVLDAAIAAHQRTRNADAGALVAAVKAVGETLAAGGRVLVFGNGGSAADAQHMVAELVGRFQRDRRGFAAVALTADTATLTSVANDYGFDEVFARQVDALGRKGDLAVAISTSGASPNVVKALDAARRAGMATIALTGRDGGKAGTMADIHVNVPESSTARIQEVHRTLIHAICELVESEHCEG